MRDCLKLTVYFGERARSGRGYLADALADVYARHQLQASLVLRGAEGFGARHGRRTDRLLTLSEDLPMVSVAVDLPQRIHAAAREVEELAFAGLVTLERVRMITPPVDEADPEQEPEAEAPAEAAASSKLTVYIGRREQLDGRPAHQAIVDLMHGRGVAGASVLLGVDGTTAGVRRRARFLARNAEVPSMVVAVGGGEPVAEAAAELAMRVPRALITLEGVRVRRRDGQRLPDPGPRPAAPAAPAAGAWQKVTVYAGEQSAHRGRPLSPQLVRALRQAGAAGATSLRGVWGYHGDHLPHGDRFWQLARRVPVVTVILDTPQRMPAWLEIVDRLTDETGLVTSETVAALRAGNAGSMVGPGRRD